VDRRRERRPAVHAEGRPLRPSAEHQLLPAQAARPPASWSNGGTGGCRFAEADRATYLAACYSGPRTMMAGETQRYDLRLLITPFKPLDPRAQFSTRYLHAYRPVPEAKASGANTINIHHANEINPFINYPFLRAPQMKAYVDEAHRNGNEGEDLLHGARALEQGA